MKKLLIGGPALIVAVVVAFATAQLASAHSRPIRFDPAPGSVLQASPGQVAGSFTSNLRRDPSWNYIHVADAQGNRVDTGVDVTLSDDRRQMSIPLKPTLPPGMYTVNWRTWDDGDGEIFGDCYTFFVGQAAADAAYSAKSRLDGGGTCARIEVSAKTGTPVPGVTPAAAAAAAADDDDNAHAEAKGSSKSSGIPVWALALGVVAGVVVGGAGGKFIGQKK